MPVFRVTSPDGSAYDVTAPDGASEQDALAVAQAHHNALAGLSPLNAQMQALATHRSNLPPVTHYPIANEGDADRGRYSVPS